MDIQFQKVNLSLKKEFDSLKRSITYDLNRKMDNIKDHIIANNTCANPNISIFDAKAKLKQKLPITSVAQFQQYDETLSQPEMRNTLKAFFRVVIFGETKLSNCIGKLMQSVVSKAVETQYSGCGKLVRGVGKHNFSATHTFACMEGEIYYLSFKNI